jgi:hypothetical protein
LNVDGKMIRLAPGMSLTPEIKTGKRRVIEYLLSPIQRAGGESLRERRQAPAFGQWMAHVQWHLPSNVRRVSGPCFRRAALVLVAR